MNIKNENYTPTKFIEPCRSFFLGQTIDLDPFSCKEANKIIKATIFFDEKDNGLAQDWSRAYSKWVNPPYSGGLIAPCIKKTLQYIYAGETLLLVNTSNCAGWYQDCLRACSALIFPFKRIQFFNPYEDRKNKNRYDQTLFYFGDRPKQFAQKLKILGTPVFPFREF